MNKLGYTILLLLWIIVGLPIAIIWATLALILSVGESKHTIVGWMNIIKELWYGIESN